MFFSLFRQREGTKRDHVARFGQNRLQLFVLVCGTRFAQTSPRPAYGAVLSRCICCLPSRYRNHLRSIVLGQRTKVKGSLPFRERLRVGERVREWGRG